MDIGIEKISVINYGESNRDENRDLNFDKLSRLKDECFNLNLHVDCDWIECSRLYKNEEKHVGPENDLNKSYSIN